jgi:2-hydroxy-6-oxonona-2,4-dienedioate hydrolase
MKKLWIVTLALAAVSVVSAQPASKQIELYGQKIHYLEAGEGPAVILLHGLGGDATNWAQTIPVLAKSFHVYAPDQIGFGDSAKPMIDYRVGTLVDFLDAFCNKLQISKASIVGNSLGGWTAMGFALAHPDKVDRMVLVDSAGYSLEHAGGVKPTREAIEALNPSTLEGSKALIRLIFANKAMANDQVAATIFAAHLSKGDGYTIDRFIDSVMSNQDVIDGKLGAIKASTLVIWGREDALLPLASGQSLAKDIAGSQIVILDHCGHIPQVECAAPFNAALLKFLAVGP